MKKQKENLSAEFNAPAAPSFRALEGLGGVLENAAAVFMRAVEKSSPAI